MSTKVPVLCSKQNLFLFYSFMQGFLIFLLHCVRNSEVRIKSFLFKNATDLIYIIWIKYFIHRSFFSELEN